MRADDKRTKTRNAPNETSLLVWNIPCAVKRRFKRECDKQGVEMRAALIGFMTAFPVGEMWKVGVKAGGK